MRFSKLGKKKLNIITVFILAAFLALSTSSSPIHANALSSYEQEAIDLLNKDRTSLGLSPLKVDMRLVLLGRDHAADMIKRNYFSHINPDGQSPFDRMKKAGIRYRAAGENIAMNYSVKDAQERWMQSPGHRANILNKDFTHVGIGVVKNNRDGSLYLVQVFSGVAAADLSKVIEHKTNPVPNPNANPEPVWPVGGNGGTDLKNYPQYSWGSQHSGTDIVAPAGTPVLASYDGVVFVSDDTKDANGNYVGFGKLIIIQSKVNGKPVYIFYAHLSERLVSQGMQVSAGQMIGKVGSTGKSDGNHLHYEVRDGNTVLNPHDYLPKR